MTTRQRTPSRLLLATEGPRAGLDLATLGLTWPLLTAARRGNGHPVLMLPGFLAGDPTTILLRNILRARGHHVVGWSQGTNRGPTGRVVRKLRAQLDRLHDESGRKVSLVGWSLGGLYAQELARAAPGSVRQLVTLGSPVTRSAGWVQTMSRLADRSPQVAGALPRAWAETGSLRVPATSVYSRTDGIVPWSACRYEGRGRRENVEVRGSHLGLGCNPAVLWVLADRLGAAESSWTPFRPPRVLRPLFPGPR